MIPQQAEIDLIVDERIQFLKAWHHEKITRRDLMDIKNSHLATDLEKEDSEAPMARVETWIILPDGQTKFGRLEVWVTCVSKSKPKKRIPFHPWLDIHWVHFIYIDKIAKRGRASAINQKLILTGPKK